MFESGLVPVSVRVWFVAGSCLALVKCWWLVLVWFKVGSWLVLVWFVIGSCLVRV